MRTTSGRDWQARVMGDTGSDATGTYAPANYIGLTANSTAPSSGNASLSGEITTGTLARAQATYAHTDGTDSYTLSKTFVSDQAVTVAKIGIFNAPSGGTMSFVSLLDTPAVMVSGDQLSIVSTIVI